MKIAVVYSGQYRTYSDFPNWRENHIAGFPDADYYYTCWDDHWADNAPDWVTKFPIPVLDHNPYLTPYFESMFRGKSVTNKGKQESGTFATLGHWLALQYLPTKYDVIIRMRYDAILDENGSHKDMFYEFCQRAVNEHMNFGFGNHKYSEDRDVRIHRKTPRILRPIIYYRINDFLNIHRPEAMVNPFHLSQMQRLLPHNEGWYQVLGEPAGFAYENWVAGVHIWRKISTENYQPYSAE